MATWHEHKPWGDLTPAPVFEVPAAANPDHPASDVVYWSIWCVTAREALRVADPDRAEEILATFAGEQAGPRKYAGIMAYVERAQLIEARDWNDLMTAKPGGEDDYLSAAERFGIVEIY